MCHEAESEEIWQALVSTATDCNHPRILDTVQTLWSGFGSVFRVAADNQTLIVKHVNPAGDHTHPRGWDSDLGTRRKLKSYEVESHWYQYFSHRCTPNCRVPRFRGCAKSGHQSWLLLEDLDAAGFPLRFQALEPQQALVCLKWLANFHAQFMQSDTEGLWQTGTYWHLQTRPDEFVAMTNQTLKQNAAYIDQLLNQCQFKSLVHGDAKVANFCFSESGATDGSGSVAAVDFQYVGGGCGMKDVAYFIGSCFTEDECIDYAQELLDEYFATLGAALESNTAINTSQLQSEWRSMYPLAWTDFYRFLDGWMPSHKKIHKYTKAMAEQTIARLPSS